MLGNSAIPIVEASTKLSIPMFLFQLFRRQWEMWSMSHSQCNKLKNILFLPIYGFQEAHFSTIKSCLRGKKNQLKHIEQREYEVLLDMEIWVSAAAKCLRGAETCDLQTSLEQRLKQQFWLERGLRVDRTFKAPIFLSIEIYLLLRRNEFGGG